MSVRIDQAFLRSPVKLSPDVFTPRTRTPWAGTRIADQYKSRVVGVSPGMAIGESWDFSCDPAFPSRVMGRHETLLELVERFPREVLSEALASRGACEILVKLLHAAEPLSVQVHPADGDPSLRPGECGKPESWLILDAEPGAGLWIGFSRALSRQDLAAALRRGSGADGLMHFVAVKPGDYFEIAPGVAHAIGPGVVVLEPQRILQGKSGKTYRLYDWGRCYDASGRSDPVGGRARELHIDEGLRLVDPEHHVGDRFVDSLRRLGKSHKLCSEGRWVEYPANDHYQVHRLKLQKGSRCRCRWANGYGAWLTLAGSATLMGADQREVCVSTGEPALLPAWCQSLDIGAGQDLDAVMVFPASTYVRVGDE